MNKESKVRYIQLRHLHVQWIVVKVGWKATARLFIYFPTWSVVNPLLCQV